MAGYSFFDHMDTLYGERSFGEVSRHVAARRLPIDTVLRIVRIGPQTEDPETQDGARLASRCIHEVLGFLEGSEMSELVQALMTEDLPPVLINTADMKFGDTYSRDKLHGIFASNGEPDYVSKEDLITAINQRRKAQGKALDDLELFVDTSYVEPKIWSERSVCSGIAHRLWSAVSVRAFPEIYARGGVQKFYLPDVRLGARRTVYVKTGVSDSLARWLVTGRMLIHPYLLEEIYYEARTTGIKGIGRVGLEDLLSVIPTS